MRVREMIFTSSYLEALWIPYGNNTSSDLFPLLCVHVMRDLLVVIPCCPKLGSSNIV